MAFRTQNGLRYLTFDIFPENVVQAIFTRDGGVSPSPWTALNVGGTVGDERSRVVENRLRAFHALKRDPDSLFDVWQVHSADVVVANAPHHSAPPEFKADAILTDNPQVTLFMRFADCVPVFLHDPKRNVIGVVHAGWLGTVRKVAEAAVRMMHAVYGTRPNDVLAAIGPSIGPDHYEVGPDVVAHVRHAFGKKQAEQILLPNTSHVHFDLWAANRLTLQRAGVEQIELSSLCTACHPQDWYSHRAQKGKTGRFGALIALA